VFINFQDFDGHQPPPGERTLPGIPTRNIFLGMARELLTAAREFLPVLELPDLGAVPQRSSLLFRKFLDNKLPTWFENDQPFTRFRTLLEIIRDAVSPKRLLLILDEFDRIQEGIASGITSDQVPENIRHIFQTYGDIGGIFTGSRTIRRLRQDYWNVLFGLGESHQLRGLEEKSALDLVEKPVAGRLVSSICRSPRRSGKVHHPMRQHCRPCVRDGSLLIQRHFAYPKRRRSWNIRPDRVVTTAEIFPSARVKPSASSVLKIRSF
jgi:hypothetical protein